MMLMPWKSQKRSIHWGGVLEQMPVVRVQLPGIRTKVSRRLAAMLIDASTDAPSAGTSASSECATAEDNQNNKGSMTIYIDDLLEVIKREIMYASWQGNNCTFTLRAQRMLRKAAVVAIKESPHNLFDTWIGRMNDSKDIGKGKAVENCMSMSTPSVHNTRRPMEGDITRRLMFGGTPDNNQQMGLQTIAPLITPPVDLTINVEADESDVDIVLTELKEQTILQNLLCKNVLDKNQCLLTLEHKNGRKLRLFIPPDSKSTNAFVDDAKQWVNNMLCTEVQRKGMLMFLAKTQPIEYLRAANKKC